METKSRQANYEALRILSMLMIIAMHYLQKGQILVPLSEDRGLVNLLAWLVEACCIGAANTYVLLSGYFLTEASWKWQKLVSLAAQILFYSVGISLVCLGLGIGNVRDWNLYDWITVVLPLQSEHYWFATAYLALYLFAPVLQAGVKKLTKKQFQLLLACLLIFFSLEKTLSPVALAYDRYGYDLGWFICLFLMAAYLRLHGKPWKGKKAWLVYGGTAAAIWLLSLVLGVFTERGFPLSYMGDMLYSYNHLLVLLLSVALFGAFGSLPVGGQQRRQGSSSGREAEKEPFKEKRAGTWITALSPYCFGVYLLHEHIALRYLWQEWLGVERVRGSLIFLPHMLACLILVFGIGTAVDYLRSRLFGLMTGKLERTKGR